MRDDYEFLLALSNEADEEVRSQIRLICEKPTIAAPAKPPARGVLPRRPETSRHDAR
ncbi:hypothetical protein [Azospirillum sp.]|uniref:hypothetical protein n=1 Tax=Azospirillum sp. TaxID=34012 RepID=UPI003D728F8A